MPLFKDKAAAFLEGLTIIQREPGYLEIVQRPCSFLEWFRQMTADMIDTKSLSPDHHLGQPGSVTCILEAVLKLTPIFFLTSLHPLPYLLPLHPNRCLLQTLNKCVTQESSAQPVPLGNST